MRKSIALFAALGLLGLTACTNGGNVSSLSEFSHIHNMVVDGEQVFIGSHEGLYQQVENGEWTRVSKEFDVMALAEVDGKLLASGHPGRGFDLPEPIGLVSSQDSGKTWSPTSLTGEVDFHLLEASGETVIGVAANYGVLVKSSDSGVTWTTLNIPALTDLAIDPNDEESVWLSTEEGLQQSNNGGETFRLAATAVTPILLDWSENALYGATSDTVWRWDNDTTEWVSIKTGFDNISALSSSTEYIAVIDGNALTKIPV